MKNLANIKNLVKIASEVYENSGKGNISKIKYQEYFEILEKNKIFGIGVVLPEFYRG